MSCGILAKAKMQNKLVKTQAVRINLRSDIAANLWEVEFKRLQLIAKGNVESSPLVCS